MPFIIIPPEMHPTSSQRLQARQEPREPHVLLQSWKDLLFLHWACDPDEIQRTLPPGLTVDTFRGKAYLGLVPFKIEHTRAAGLPAFPGVSDFLELNVRTYVHDDSGCPGVWFYSLECTSRLAVLGARRLWRLPYHFAQMQFESSGQPEVPAFHFRHARNGIETDFTWRRLKHIGEAAPNTLDYFLIERYVLFAWNFSASRLYRAQVHHQPYSLFEANGTSGTGVIELAGLRRPLEDPCHIIASTGMPVRIYPLHRIA